MVSRNNGIRWGVLMNKTNDSQKIAEHKLSLHKIVVSGLKLAGILALVLFISCVLYIFLPSHPNIKHLADITGINFPLGAHLVYSYETRLTPGMRAIIKINRRDTATFVASFPPGSYLSSEIQIFQPGNGRWNPGKPNKFISAIIKPIGHPRTKILISMDDPRHATVYLEPSMW